MDEKIRVIDTVKDLKVFNDPFRMKIINVYKNQGVPLTVKQCSEFMGEVPSKVHYHVQKLLSIDILTLDHIEVINGINAKYYTLPNKAFTIALKDRETQEVYSENNEVELLLGNLMSEFKEQFIYATNNEKQSKDQSKQSFFSSNNIYLSDDEYEEISNLIEEIGKKHSSKKEGKEKYSILTGLTRIK